MADFPLFIDGEFRDALSGATFETRDPATGELIGTVAEAGVDDARAAIAAARRAFDNGRWSGLAATERAEVLQRVAGGIAARFDELAQLEARDSGSVLTKAQAADVGQAMSWFAAMAELAPLLDQPEALPPSPFGSTNTLRREPIGVCAAITPWNFPLAMAAWKLSMALAAGNTVVLKPAEQTPCTALRLAEILRDAGVPDGVVNVIPGPGPGTGEELCIHPDVDKVSFTGSTAVGRHIMTLAAGTLKTVTLELGGKSAQIVLDDADLDLVIDGALYAGLFHSGQACTAGSRLLVSEARHDEVVERLRARMADVTVGLPLQPGVNVGPLVSQEQLDTVLGYIELGEKEGATLLVGGGRPAGADLAGGFFVEPTLFTDVTADMTIAQEEIFGPVITVLRYRDEDEAVAIANGTPYGLAAGVWGEPIHAGAVAGRLRAGTVWVNDWHMLSPMYPFGGFKQSGIGREHGLMGLLGYTEAKHVHVAATTTVEGHPWFGLTVAPQGAQA